MSSQVWYLNNAIIKNAPGQVLCCQSIMQYQHSHIYDLINTPLVENSKFAELCTTKYNHDADISVIKAHHIDT